jgi:hypothetical protein
VKLVEARGAELRRKRGKRTRELEGKAAGDEYVFIPGEGPDWQMRSGSDTIPDAAGGEGVTGPLNRMA